MRNSLRFVAGGCGLLLVGCAAAPELHLTAAGGADETVFVAPALQATVRQFLGDSGPGGGDGTALGGIDGDTLSPGGGTPYARTHSRRRQIGVEWHRPLTTELAMVGRLQIGTGDSRYVLPQGSGILTDPITITFVTRHATLEGGLAWSKAVTPRFGYEIGGGLGLRITRTETAVTSALLQVQNSSLQQDGYGTLRAGFWVRPDPAIPLRLQTEAEVLAYPGQNISGGLRIMARY